MKGVKIVTIGGGSSYTPELMQGFIKRYSTLPIREIWLVDIPDGKKKLEIVGALAQRMWDASGYDVKVHLTLDRREALKDADFVTTQFRVGLLTARIKDERIPLSHGMIGQETNGAGGMFKLLRTAPVIAQIIQDMKELCPNAWLINFTNPSGMITETVIRQCGWKKCIGLCNVPVNIMKNEPVMIGKKEGDLDFVFGGLNHFHFHRAYDKKTGQEVTHEIARAMMKDAPIDVFVASDLHRAIQTCAIIAAPHGVGEQDIVTTPLLRERDWGGFMGKYIPDLQDAEWPDDVLDIGTLWELA